jgi:hypothetical protein
VEGEKVCRHDSSVQNYCLLGQRRPHDNKLDWHDPAVVGLQAELLESTHTSRLIHFNIISVIGQRLPEKILVDLAFGVHLYGFSNNNFSF